MVHHSGSRLDAAGHGAQTDGPAGAAMTAIVADRYGSADVLQPAAVDRPVLAPGEVLLRVRAAGLDRGTWHLMTGRPSLVRLLGYGLRRPKQRIPGLDVSGVVVEVADDVTRFEPGDEVFGVARGSFAEYAAARADKLAHKPVNLSFEQAAVVPVSGLTALQGLRDAGRVEAGQSVLVLGASGGVGTFAVQLARAYGARVTGVCSPAKADLVRSLGADDVLDYTSEDVTDGSRRYDLILDMGGNRSLSQLRRALTPTGALVVVGGEGGGRITGGFGRSLRAVALSPFVRQRLTMLISTEHSADLEVLRSHIEAGEVTPVLDRTYPLADAAAAMRRLEAGEARGKIALTV